MNKKYHIVIVDDERPIVQSICRLFAFEEDLILHGTNDPNEGLSFLKKYDIDVFISDQHMPKQLGVELLRAVRSESPNTSRILFSGHVDIELLRSAVNDGEVYRFITKPWDEDEFRLAVRHGIERSHLLRQNNCLEREREQQNQQLRRFNQDLSAMVAERTASLEAHNQALQLNQTVLDRLPVLAIGIAPDGLIALVNAMARHHFPNCVPGLHYQDAFPQKLSSWLDNWQKSTHNTTQHILNINGMTWAFNTQHLQDRGFVLTAHNLQESQSALG